MGITLQFSLRLPAFLSREETTAHMEVLHQAVADLPFQTQSALACLSEADMEAALSEFSTSVWREACLQHHRRLYYRVDLAGIPRRSLPDRESYSHSVRIRPTTLIGFSCWPGPGCGSFEAFVGDYPASTLVSYLGRSPNRSQQHCRFTGDEPRRWTGSARTDTQVSGDIVSASSTDSVRSHLLVIAALDLARGFGFTTEVNDDSGYWTCRNVQALLAGPGAERDLDAVTLELIRRTNGTLISKAAIPAA